MRIDNVIKSVLDKLIIDSPRSAIGFIGSAARATEITAALRDIDLLVIDSGNRAFQREVFKKDTLSFDISYISTNDLQNQIAKKSRIWVKALEDFKAIHHGDIELSALKNIDEICSIDKMTTESLDDTISICGDLIKFIRFDLTDRFEYMVSKKDDKILYNYLKDNYLKELVEAYFEINGLIIPKLKSQLKELAKRRIDLLVLIESYYDRNHDDNIVVLDDLLDEVLKEHGGRLYEFTKGNYPIDR